MKKTDIRQSDPNVLAVLHRTGRVWRGIIARLPGNGRTAQGGKPRLLAHREFSASEGSRMDGWLDQHDVGQVVCVLHASSVICRTCPLPDAPVDQLGPALRLQAEAHLFGIAPPHRLGMAVLDAAPGETSRSGIILAWPESSPAELPPIQRDMRFAPDVAALACLLNGYRPTQPLAWVDREDGSLALAVSHSGGAVFRGLREDASDVEAWKAAVGRVIAETCLTVGHTASFSDSIISLARERISGMASGEARLLAPPEVIAGARERLENAPSEDTWWSHFGIAAGVVLARAGDLAPLTELQESPPSTAPSPLTTLVNALSSRRAAAIAVAACLVVLLFGSLVVQGTRLAILRIKHPEQNLRAELYDVNVIRNQLVLYRELDRNSWSMTKLLADIVSNTPEGIELDHINVSQQRTFDVRGRAIPHGPFAAPEVIGLMRQYLIDSGIFEDVALNLGDGDAFGHYQFRLSARLRRPFLNFEYRDERDWARWTYLDRIMGRRPGTEIEEDEEEMLAAGSPEDVDELIERVLTGEITDPERDLIEYAQGADVDDERFYSNGERVRPTISGSRLHDPNVGRIGDPNVIVSSAEADIPPELTEAEVAAMSMQEVQDALTRIAKARPWARTRDPELDQRLRREFEWLMDRMRSAQQR